MGDKPQGTLPLESAEIEAPVQRFRLEVTAGPDAGASFTSKGELTTIGTHRNADLVLTDPTVSRFHCEIRIEGGRAVVRDLQSKNGTRIDRVLALAAPLSSGATLTLGQTIITFRLEGEVVRLPTSPRRRFGTMVGASVAMRRVFAVLERAAASDSTVLLEGETGTGKEAVAESIHHESARRDGPFVVVDCAAIPANLLESELFGWRRGAFTGAVEAREGAFEAARGGTVFLDEIGELAPELQPKLLRVLERREVKRVGATQHEPVDVRVVAATNRDLRAEVNARRFRSDLYFRLAVVEVRLPPLRERPDDIGPLVEHLLESLGRAGSPEAAPLREPAFLQELGRHGWPGNVRELRNYLERCLTMHERAPMQPPAQASELAIDLSRPLREVRDHHAREVERRYLVAVLERHNGNVTAAARAAGVERPHFYRLLWRHGLK